MYTHDIVERKILVVEKTVGLLSMVFWRSLKEKGEIGLQKRKSGGEDI